MDPSWLSLGSSVFSALGGSSSTKISSAAANSAAGAAGLDLGAWDTGQDGQLKKWVFLAVVVAAGLIIIRRVNK